LRKRKGILSLLILVAFALGTVLSGCGAVDLAPPKPPEPPKPAAPATPPPAQTEAPNRPLANWDEIENGDIFKQMLVPMAVERIEAGTLTVLSADYIFYLQIVEKKFPRGEEPSFTYALDNPNEFPVPDNWDGPKYMEAAGVAAPAAAPAAPSGGDVAPSDGPEPIREEDVPEGTRPPWTYPPDDPNYRPKAE